MSPEADRTPDEWIAALRTFLDLVARDPIGALIEAPRMHPTHLRALISHARATVTSVHSAAAGAFFAQTGRALRLLDVVDGHRASMAKAARHARKMQDDRAGLRAAVTAHFLAVMESGREPSDAELAVWEGRGIRRDGFWPWPKPDGFVADPPDDSVFLPDVDVDAPSMQDLKDWATAVLAEAGGWEAITKAAQPARSIPTPPAGPPVVFADDLGRTRCLHTSKLCFIDSAAAKRARIHAKRTSAGATEMSIRAYECPHCGLWHNTSRELLAPRTEP